MRAHDQLVSHAAQLLPRGGLLAAACCAQRVAADEYRRALLAASARAGRAARIVYTGGQPYDHPVLLGVSETEYLKFFIVQFD